MRQGTGSAELNAGQAPESLRRWNEFLGTPDCPCPSEHRGLGRLYGVSMGKGWVRMDTDPECPHHGRLGSQPTG